MAKMMGYDLTDNADEAELVVVNTCAVREHAELKALSVVGKFKANKTANPDLIIAVVGCMAAEAHMAEKIKKSYRFVSVSFGGVYLYDYLCDDESIGVGDRILVNASGERKAVTVQLVTVRKEYELSLPLTEYKRVICKV